MDTSRFLRSTGATPTAWANVENVGSTPGGPEVRGEVRATEFGAEEEGPSKTVSNSFLLLLVRHLLLEAMHLFLIASCKVIILGVLSGAGPGQSSYFSVVLFCDVFFSTLSSLTS